MLAKRLESQMSEIDRRTAIDPVSGAGRNGTVAGAGGNAGEERGTERRERAMAEAALTLAEIGE